MRLLTMSQDVILNNVNNVNIHAKSNMSNLLNNITKQGNKQDNFLQRNFQIY